MEDYKEYLEILLEDMDVSDDLKERFFTKMEETANRKEEDYTDSERILRNNLEKLRGNSRIS